jgi:hypothetical protein
MSLEQYSDDPDEPTNYNDALSSEDGILWKKQWTKSSHP